MNLAIIIGISITILIVGIILFIIMRKKSTSNTTTTTPSTINSTSNTPNNLLDSLENITNSSSISPTISPIDCTGNWSDWSTCNKTCGGGTKNRTYNVTTTKNSIGQDCPVSDKTIDTSSCNTNACPIPCLTTDWSEWSVCNRTCGDGQKTRTKTIIQQPAYGGTLCPAIIDTSSCNLQECSQDCKVSIWSPWSTCSKSCGSGTRYRTRTVTSSTTLDGASCPSLREEEPCNTQLCPIDCAVSDWSNWSTCNATCGGGTQTRTRTITTQPANGGTICPALSENIVCNTQSCTTVETNIAVAGNARETEFNFDCPSGSYITKLYGRSGDWQDAIGAKCSNNLDSGLKGGNTGNAYAIDCSDGFTAINMKTKFFGPYVATIQPTCGNIKLSMLGTPAGIIENKDLACPQGYAIGRMFGHHGSYVNRLGFECVPKN
jgi:hypothetical protein|uniref:Spondin-like TSP1 domain-containing protein n=1 Tax=viral metagenome TaxID=1070528 RepID=A0A6C0M157_9ZZZZ